MSTRLLSLIRKEFIQIVRDPRTLFLTFVIPVVMLFLLGYGATVLRALGLTPTVFHANEGHSAFLTLERIRTYALAKRKSKVTVKDFARSPRVEESKGRRARTGPSVAEFLDSLPHILAAEDLREIVGAIVRARAQRRASSRRPPPTCTGIPAARKCRSTACAPSSSSRNRSKPMVAAMPAL